MKNLKEKLADVKIEQLEERKEFTFYVKSNPQPSCDPKPPCQPSTPSATPDPGNGGGSGWG